MTDASTFTVTESIDFAPKRRVREAEAQCEAVAIGRVSRLARLMALAIKFQKHLDDGVVESQAELARISHVSRARITQIMNLLHLAPDVQEAILNLPRTRHGRDAIREIHIKPICRQVDWGKQRAMWQRMVAKCSKSGGGRSGPLGL